MIVDIRRRVGQLDRRITEGGQRDSDLLSLRRRLGDHVNPERRSPPPFAPFSKC
jgi:hypothetical protein